VEAKEAGVMKSAPNLGDECQGILVAFERALGQEGHVLVRSPELTWQQLHNRLQWVEGPVAERVAAERERRSAPGARPWLRRCSRVTGSERLIRSLAGHVGEVTAVRYDSLGRRIFTAGDDGSLRVWDGESGRLITVLLEQEANLLSFDLSTDTRSLAVGDIDGQVTVVAIDGRRIVSFSPSVAPVRACGLSPTEAAVVVGSADGGLSVWDAISGRQLVSLTGHRGGTLGCVFDPAGAGVVSVGADGSLAVHDVRSGTCAREKAGEGAPLYCCAVAPSGELIATGGEDGILRIWDARSHALLQSLETGSPLLGCRFGPSGRLLATGDQEGGLKVWQAGAPGPLTVLAGHTAWINACDFAPDESVVVSASADETVKVWSLPSFQDGAEPPADLQPPRGATRPEEAGSAHRILPAPAPEDDDRPEGGILHCTFSSDGALLATAGLDGRVRLRRVPSGEVVAVLRGHDGPATGCAFLPDGRHLITSGRDHLLMVWDLETGAGEVLARHPAPIYCCAVSADGGRLGTAGHDGVRIWDARTGDLVAIRKDHRGPAFSCAFHPGAPVLASTGEDGTVRLWRFEEDAVPRALRLHRDQVLSCAFNARGDLLATAGFDHAVLVWDTATWGAIRVLKHHAAPVRFCAFSPDGTAVVSAGWDKTVRVTEVESGRQQAVLAADGNFMCCAWSPTAPLIAAGDEWNPQPDILELVKPARRAVPPSSGRLG
jgi:WD40 repeat protein